MAPVSILQALLVAVIALAVTGLTGAAAGIAVAGIGIAAFGDLRHGYIWEEIAVPTLLAVLAARAIAGTATDAAIGAGVLGALALFVYFGGRVARKESGFGDVLPTATIGAALGAPLGLECFAVACAGFAIVALAAGKRFGVALPFGPAIAVAILLGALAPLMFPVR